MTNPFAKTRIEFHILQSFPVTCLNRDDLGSPKTAIVGGITRARVSSQCWKRQVRLTLRDLNVKLAIRTKHIADMIERACLQRQADAEKAKTCATKIGDVLAKDTLYFISEREVEAYAQYAQEHSFDLPQDKDLLKDIIKISKKTHISALDGLDLALFGRMVAKAPELNIEAASTFSHSISTHKVNTDVDFFTALDDFTIEGQEGSAHMGSLEFNSATYYRYVCLDLGQLAETLGIENRQSTEIQKAIEAFVKALYLAVPQARQHTLAGECGWDYAKVYVRKGQPLQYSCDEPVRYDSRKGGGYLQPSIAALNEFLSCKERMSGSLFGKLCEYELSAQQGTIDELIQVLQKAICYE